MEQPAEPPVPLRRNREFLLLQSGQLVSTLGSGMSTIAYPLLALAVTHSAAAAGYVSAVRFLPQLTFSVVAGLTADRVDRRRQMIVADMTGVVALAVLAAAVATGRAELWLILLVAFVDSAARRFYVAASQGAFRSVVPSSQLATAASTVQARAAVVRLSSSPIGGALFAVARSVPFVADSLSYFASTAALLLMRTRFQEDRALDRAPLRAQFREGLTAFLGIPFLRVALGMVAVSNFTVSGVQLAVIVLADRDKLSSAAIGGLLAVVAASTLLGSLASPLLRRVASLNIILLSELWAVLAYVAFLVVPNIYVLDAAFAVQAFCFPNTDAALSAYSYVLIPDAVLGRAMAVSNTLRSVTTPLGPLVAGLMLAATTPRLTIGVLMGATVLAAAVGTAGTAIRKAPSFESLTAG